MLQTMETFQEMSQTISALQEIFPDMSASSPFSGSPSEESDAGPDTFGTGSFSMMDMLMNMLTPEQKEMFEMFQQQNLEPYH